MKKFKLFLLSIILFSFGAIAQNGSVPELIYYKFNNVTTSVSNDASTPVGINPAPITGALTVGAGGFNNTNGLVGTGLTSTGNVINTGWLTSITSDFTLAFWTSNVPSSATLYYIFGDAGATSFRCFTNGAAGATNWMVRGPFPDVTFAGAATMAPSMMHVVYNSTALTVTGYLNGVQVAQVNVPSALNVTGTGLTVGGYTSSTGLAGVLDEFRWYNRALTAQEITNTYNFQLPLTSSPNDAAAISIDSPSVFCAGPQNVVATIANYGTNRIDSVRVNWEVDGVLQTPVKYIGLLDTLNGSFSKTAQVLLGSINFPAATPKSIKVWTSFPNGVADTSNFNDTVNTVKAASLAGGVYTINSLAAPSATNFVDFASLFNTINQFGACGSITVNVASGSGPYLEQVNIKNFAGSPSRTLTINGNGETVNFAATLTGERSTLVVENSSYVTINNLNVEASGTVYGVAFFAHNIDNVTVDGCSFTVDQSSTSTNYACVRISGVQTSNTTATTSNNFTFTNNQLVGGYNGLTIYGNSGSPSTNITIEGNSISEFYNYGTYFLYTNGLTVEQNDISRPTRINSTTAYGVYGSLNTNMLVNRNAIHNLFDGALTSTSACYPIYSTNDATIGNENVFSNNLIYNINHNGTIYGIYDLGSDHTKFYNNTISLDNTASTAGLTRGIFNSSSATGLEFQNNIVSVTRGGSGIKYGIYLSTSSTITSNYNNVYVASAGSGAQYYGYVGSNQATLIDFQTAGYGLNDINADPLFNNIALDDYSSNNISLNASGFSTSLVPVDFFGTARIASAMDIGAIEVTSPALDVSVSSFGLPTTQCAGTTSVDVNLSNNGTLAIDSVIVNWSINGVTQTPIHYKTKIDTIGSIAGNSASIFLTNYSLVSGVAVDFEVWLTQPNGLIAGDAFPSNDSLMVTTGGALAGMYTLNSILAPSVTNYITFTDFTNAVSLFGFCGNVTLDVVVGSGPYAESVSFTSVNGINVTDTLFVNGNGEEITYASTLTDDRSTLSIENSSNIIVNDLIISATGTFGTGVFLNNIQNVEISDCQVTLPNTSTSANFTGISLSGSESSISTSSSGNNVRILRNRVDGAYYSFNIYGTSGNTALKNVVVKDNTFADFYAYGARFYYVDSLLFEGNEIYQTNRTAITSTYGIYSFSNSNLKLNRNAIHDLATGIPTSTSLVYVIYNSSDVTVGNENIFMNNLIYNINNNGTIYGIYDLGSDNNKYYNNTISLDNVSATAGITRGIYNSATATGLEFMNNIVTVTRGGSGIKYGIYLSAGISANYNDVFVNSSGTGAQYYGYANSSNQATLLDYRLTNQGLNDLDSDPLYANILGNDFTPLNSQLDGTGMSTPLVTEDYFGALRNTSSIDIGAIDFSPPAIDAGILSIDLPTTFCAGSVPIAITVSNNGQDQVDSLTVNYSIDGVPQTAYKYIGTIDTLNSVSGNIVQIPVTNYVFATGTPVVFDFVISNVNGLGQDAFSSNDSLSTTKAASLQGTLTVNPALPSSGTVYNDFVSLAAALNTIGVCGPVVVNVATGTYLDYLKLDGVFGTSTANTITIEGGDAVTTILQHDGSSSYGTVSLNAVSNITIKNMTISSTAITANSGIIMANVSDITIDSSIISVSNSVVSTSLIGVSLSGSVTSHATAAIADNVTISNSKFIGGYYGVRQYGASTLAVSNTKVLNNTFENVYWSAIYSYYANNLDFVGNTADMTQRGYTSSYGAYLFYTENLLFTENNIRSIGYGVYQYNFTDYFKRTRKNRYVNNMIHSANSYGAYLYYVDSVDIIHNTIFSGSATIPAAQVYSSTTKIIEDYDVRNNIIYSSGSFAIRTNMANNFISHLDNNVYYTTGASLFSFNSTVFATLAAYKTAQPTLNINSYEGDPLFVNISNDLHVLGLLANNAGDNSVGVLVDIDGDARPISGSTTVDIGADEFNPASCFPPNVTFLNNTANSVDVTLVGGATSTWQFEYGSIGFAYGTGSRAVTATSTHTISGLMPGSDYQYYVREICGPGDTSVLVGPFGFYTLYSVPMRETFENFPAAQTGLNFTKGWTSTSTANPRWETEVSTGANVNSLNTGPLFDATFPATAGGNYFYYETSGGVLGSSNTLSSPFIAAPATSGGIVVEFAYHMYGVNMGNLYLVADTNGVLDTLVTLLGQQQTTAAAAWRDTSAVLIGYQGKNFKLKFIGSRGNGYESDMSIDEIRLRDTIAVAVSLDSIISPVSNCGLSSAEDVTIAIRNYGLSPISNFNATYEFDGGAPVTEMVTTSINPGSTFNFTFSTKVNASVLKNYTIKSYISVTGDPMLSDDTLSGNALNSFSDAINNATPTKFSDLEANNGNWTQYGANSSWAWGTPSTFYINNAFSGTKAWVTGLAGNHNANELSYLESACYDLSSMMATDPLYLQFYTVYKTEAGIDKVWMETSINNGATWNKLLPSAGSINFYSNKTANVWEGFSTSGASVWTPVVNEILGLGGNSKVKFRFVFQSNGTNQNDGFGIDNIQFNLAVGQKELLDGKEIINIQPNPSNGQFNISFGNYPKGNYQMKIVSMTGQLIQEELLIISNEFEVRQLDLKSIKKGVYFLQIINGNSVSTEKLIIK
jgi:hypothetical protein